MAAGKINLQANDGKVASITFEDGAVADATVIVPKEGGEFLTTEGAQTKNGVMTFSNSPIVPVPTLANQVISMGNILEKTGVGIGYGTGSGGTVTQLTSKSTAVTLNKPSGRITMNNSALAIGTSANFQFNNTQISATDILMVNPSNNGQYIAQVIYIASGYAGIRVTNISAGPLSEALILNFTIIKGATV